MAGKAAPGALRRRRRKRLPISRGRRTLYLTVAASALVLAAVPAGHYFGLFGRRTETAAEPPPREFAIVLGDAYFSGAGAARVIAGTVRNNGNAAYADVQVHFNLRDGGSNLLETATALVPRIGPGATAGFRTAPVPEPAVRLQLRDIAASPAPAGGAAGAR